MAIDQTIATEAIAQMVVEAARVAIQAKDTARVERTQNAGPKLGRLIMEQQTNMPS